jgi:hypothetical protein
MGARAQEFARARPQTRPLVTLRIPGMRNWSPTPPSLLLGTETAEKVVVMLGGYVRSGR